MILQEGLVFRYLQAPSVLYYRAPAPGSGKLRHSLLRPAFQGAGFGGLEDGLGFRAEDFEV